MYLSRIAPEVHIVTTPSRNTIVQAGQMEFDLGTLRRGNPTTVTALIHNVGEVSFVVYDARASCGCTSVSYKKDTLFPVHQWK